MIKIAIIVSKNLMMIAKSATLVFPENIQIIEELMERGLDIAR